MKSFWCVLFAISLPAGCFREGKAEEAIGTLGGSVTFHLKTSKQFTSITWLRTVQDNPVHFASLDLEADRPCHIKVILPKFERRLNVSRDCKNLQISKLTQDDSGRYRAQIGEDGENFRLKVYKHLLESDLEVQCEKNAPLSGENYTLQLNCSAGKWGDGVNYTWTSTSKNIKSSSSVIQNDFQDSDTNYTCTAKNPVSNASKTVSIEQACDGQGNQQEGSSASEKVIPVVIVLIIVIIAAASMGYCLWKKKKIAAHREPRDSPHCTAPDESSKTIYAQIDCLPPEIQQTGTKKPQQRKGPKTKEGPHTIYASVVQPKPVPLQTDDEKIQMEGQEAREKSKKTIYSSITKPQETEDPSIKTVYDTIHAPRCPEESDFHKFL
ncbi:T-lymphocyte surface antigen Ly-9-like isoform X2 [Eublepharis macularius]|uniref:T-lymphocyte surface antigen Ly-9-like isoform X2 n=1 Tax=Eublepharis macularius TaxID=481883 RepID=A0AA97LET9_EUBMA|nr:T-lymphocyte surface antigen Ly-9-like isoform X2 [Eublepharis macularius]